jgi:virginiamycin B lyase
MFGISFVLIMLLFVYSQIHLFEKNNTNTSSYSVTKNHTPYVNEYDLPVGSFPNGIMVDKKGFVWIVGSNSNLYKFDSRLDKIDSVYFIGNKELKPKGSIMGWAIIQDNDGVIWISQSGSNPLWRFDLIDEKFTSYLTSAAPFQMKLDEKNGNIWFTTLGGNTIGVIQKVIQHNSETDYKITEFEVGNDSFPSGLFLENDNVWVAEVVGNKLVRFKIIDDGNVISVEKTFEISNEYKIDVHSPTDIFVADNKIWFTEHGTSTISQYSLDTDQVKRFPTSANLFNATTLPFWLKESQSNGLWINEHTGNKIAFFNTTDMTLLEYQIPSRPIDGMIVYPLGLTVTQDSVWFSEWNTDKIGIIDKYISIPFDISTDISQITIPKNTSGKPVMIDFTIHKNQDVTSEKPISFVVSSSMEPSLSLVNMTAKFSNDRISPSKIENSKIQLFIDSNFAPAGNYTLAISATDGLITKSVFVDMVIIGK